MNSNIADLKNSKDFLVHIVIPGTAGARVLEGFITNELSFSGNAQYDGRSIAGSDALTSLLASGTSIWNALSDYLASKGSTQTKRIANQKAGGGATTVIQWTDSGYFSFTVEMLMISYQPEHDVREMVAPMWGALYPETVPEGLADLIDAPMGYATSPTSAKSTNTISVTVGEYFTANSLVMTEGSVSYSKELVENGSPLFAAVSCTFQATRMLSAAEVQRFFV